jgi:hypothetical protein
MNEKHLREIRVADALTDYALTIENQVRKHDDIIYGGQAIKKQGGIFARNTFDFDVSTTHPKRDAHQLVNTFNKQSGSHLFYEEPSKKHKGTEKVKFRGFTPASHPETLADFSKTRRLQTVRISGIRYATLEEIERDKRKSVSDKKYEYRHEKDSEDIHNIEITKSLRDSETSPSRLSRHQSLGGAFDHHIVKRRGIW